MVNHALLKSDTYTKPIIAAVNGDCVGGGLELMLATDIRATVPEARFGLPEAKWSIYPFGGSTTKLMQQIGYIHAMDLLLTGRLIDSEAAVRLGLVNRVMPRSELMRWAIETRYDDRGEQPFRREGNQAAGERDDCRLRIVARGAGPIAWR